MKRKLFGGMLGIFFSIGMAPVAYSQGYVTFANYGFSTFAPVTYSPGGTGVNSTFTAGLWYFLGTTTLSQGDGSLPPAGWELASVTQQFNVGAEAGPNGAGFFIGGIATIPDYTSGPITFVVTAYNGSSYNSAVSRAHSASFTLSSITSGVGQPVGEFGPGLQSFALIPEPSLLTFLGCGTAAFFFIRRRK